MDKDKDNELLLTRAGHGKNITTQFSGIFGGKNISSTHPQLSKKVYNFSIQNIVLHWYMGDRWKNHPISMFVQFFVTFQALNLKFVTPFLSVRPQLSKHICKFAIQCMVLCQQPITKMVTKFTHRHPTGL